MNFPGPPEELNLALSSYLDGELDLATRLDLEGWLEDHPEGRDRLRRLRAVAGALSGLRGQPEVPAGWTLKAYRIGLPDTTADRRRMFLGLGQAMARPRVVGHGQGGRKARRRWRIRIHR